MTEADLNADGPRGLDGSRVIVLGGSSGIGFAVARRAQTEGAEVVVASSNAQRVRDAVDRLGGNAEGRRLDLTDERAVEAFFGDIGHFDHLVFTAGDGLLLSKIADSDLAAARRAFEVRYWAALAAAKYGAPAIREGGSIVLTSGISAWRPRSGWALGASVCGAVEALARALAVEIAPIRVNVVSPGVVRTDLWQDMTEQDRRDKYEAVGRTLPVGHVGEADEVAEAYLFLMKSAFATGQTVTVDGGALLV